MTARKLAAAVCRINNALPHFPGGSNEEKFSDQEIIELLEFSVPEAWRTKFDLEGYIPSEDNKAAFIAHCEVQERHEQTVTKKPKEKITVKKAHKSAGKNKSREGKKHLTGPFFCKEHGENPTHDTASCYTLKNRAAKGGNSNSSSGSSAQRNFNGKKFRKEIHILFKNQPKKKVLDMFASVIQSEQAIISKKKASKQKKRLASDASESGSESEEDLSVHLLEVPQSRTKKVARAKILQHKSELQVMESDQSDPAQDQQDSNAMDEEQTFQKRIASLGSAPGDVDEVSSSDCDE